MLSTKDDIISECFLPKITLSESALLKDTTRGPIQVSNSWPWVMSPDLYHWAMHASFIKECYLPKINLSVGVIYQRWFHWWVLSTKDDIINGCFLPKMTSLMSTINQRWLYQWVLSQDNFINECHLPKIWHWWLLSTKVKKKKKPFINGCSLPKITLSARMSAIYLGCIISVLCKVTCYLFSEKKYQFSTFVHWIFNQLS